MTEHSIAEVVDTMTPTRIVINSEADGVAPQHTKIRPDVIFIRHDGWSLGAPKSLERVARKLYEGSWTERWQRLADGRWQKTWPLPTFDDGGAA